MIVNDLLLQMLLLNHNTILLKIRKYLLTFWVFFFAFLCIPVKAEQLSTQIISVEPFVEIIDRTGKVGFKRTVDLSFKSNGYLEKLNVDEGDYFSKGQLLAKLDDAVLIAEKNASYARLLQAKRQVARIKTLINNKLSSQQALDDAQAFIQTRRADFNVAEYKLSKSQIVAPFDGVVVNRFSSLGELQMPNENVLTIAALVNNAIVSITLTDEQMSLVNEQLQVVVNLRKIGKVFATASKIPASADSLNHLFSVDFLLNDINIKQINVGSLAKVTAKIATNTFVYKLPIEALNGVDKQGRALITISKGASKALTPFIQKAFDIIKISNKHIYLLAQQEASPITVIDQGWQILTYKK
jgi:RND family efflux transporter MFP subunit